MINSIVSILEVRCIEFQVEKRNMLFEIHLSRLKYFVPFVKIQTSIIRLYVIKIIDWPIIIITCLCNKFEKKTQDNENVRDVNKM